VTSMARHREPSLPTHASGSCGSAHIGSPRPTCSRVTTADGMSPGLRVLSLHRLPRTRVPRGVMTEEFAAYSCGGSCGFE
jgi:hypothetical protein